MILVEVLLVAGLLLLYRKISHAEVRFDEWRLETLPSLRESRFAMRDMVKLLDKLEIQMETLAGAGGVKARAAFWILGRLLG